MSRLEWLLGLSLCVACAAPPHLAALADVDAVAKSPKAKDAEQLAPQAFLHAEKLHREADEAFDEGRRANAQALAEHAIAAYQHAFVLSRVARAERRIQDADARLVAAKKELAALDTQQARVAAEADDLEMRIKVARDALEVAEVAPTTPKREQARLESARAIALQARLLCVATSLLDETQEGLTGTVQKLDALEAAIEEGPKIAPIADAMRLRANCLAHLTRARRPGLEKAPEVSRGDALLEQLSRAKLEPHRDDRGVVVVVSDAFRGTDLRPPAKERLSALGQVARELSDTPVLAVVHSARGRASKRERDRAEAVARALREAGAPKVASRAAGDAAPLLPRGAPRARKHNERVEVVFVTPSW